MKLATIGTSKLVAALSGLFILLGIAIVTGWLYFQVVKPGQRASYFIFMTDVSGIRPGTEVQVHGFPVGQVDRISPDLDIDEIEFRVDIVIDKIWPIPIGSTITITSDGLLSTPILALEPGKTDQLLAEGGRILTLPPASGMGDRLSDLLADEVPKTFANLNRTLDSLQSALDNDLPGLLEEAGYVLSTTSRTLAALESESEKLAIGIGDIGEQMSRLGAETKARQVEGVLDDLAATATTLKGASLELQRLLETSGALVESSQQILTRNEAAVQTTIDDSAYTMQTIATSVTLVLQNLERLTRDLAEISGKINRDPGVLLTGPAEEDGPIK